MSIRNSENIWVLSGFLGITGIVAAGILALVSRITAEPIRAAGTKNELAVLKKLNLPEFDNDMTVGKISTANVEYSAAQNKGKIVGYAAKVACNDGYGGRIQAMISFDTEGKILAVSVLEHNETPGLGAAVCERKFQKTIFNIFSAPPEGLPPNVVLDQFHGRKAVPGCQWKIKKDGGDMIYRTGATVTSRAVTRLVSDAAANFSAAKARFEKEGVK